MHDLSTEPQRNAASGVPSTTIKVERTRTPSPKPPEGALGFGKYFTDHVLSAEWDEERGWSAAVIRPRASVVTLSPAAGAVQYGQAIFEGLKAFASSSGPPRLFRPEKHAARMASSARRVCLPEIPASLFLDGVRALVRADADWVPRAPGTSLYVRPTLFATEPFLGVRPTRTASFLVLLSPVGGYFSGGRRALRIWVERDEVRAAPGGLGAAKTGANYAASLAAAERAKKLGFDQVLWLDAVRRASLEEIGTMNVFVKINGVVATPSLDEGTILAGVTRDSVLSLLRTWGVPVEERRIDLAELEAAAEKGQLEEMWGTGTAALISPIGELGLAGGRVLRVGDGQEGPIARRLCETLVAIQTGAAADPYGWTTPV